MTALALIGAVLVFVAAYDVLDALFARPSPDRLRAPTEAQATQKPARRPWPFPVPPWFSSTPTAAPSPA